MFNLGGRLTGKDKEQAGFAEPHSSWVGVGLGLGWGWVGVWVWVGVWLGLGWSWVGSGEKSCPLRPITYLGFSYRSECGKKNHPKRN